VIATERVSDLPWDVLNGKAIILNAGLHERVRNPLPASSLSTSASGWPMPSVGGGKLRFLRPMRRVSLCGRHTVPHHPRRQACRPTPPPSPARPTRLRRRQLRRAAAPRPSPRRSAVPQLPLVWRQRLHPATPHAAPPGASSENHTTNRNTYK
jgi:hypothetical protein